MRRRTKYGNTKTEVDGFKFDSKAEAIRYGELKLLMRAGEISDLTLQEPFILKGANGEPLLSDAGRKLKYVCDFRYYDLKLGVWVIEDKKGFLTKEYKLKKAIMRGMGLNITET